MITSKRIIFITESQAINLLFEAASLSDIHSKYYSQIPDDIFQDIISTDPTYNPNKPDKMGKYGKWLLTIYLQGKLKIEDLYKAKDDLTVFIKYQSKLEQKDINKYHSLQDLYSAIKPFVDNPQQAATKSEEIRQLKQGAEKVYEDNKWIVIVPHTQDAACYYGKGTRWCTAATGSYNYFDDYNKEGLLYINIVKGTDIKFQFHFETSSYMYASDEPIEHPVAQTIGLSDGLVNFYVSKYGSNAAIDLTTEMNSESIECVKDLPNYYILDDQAQLATFNKQTRQFEIIYEVNDYYHQISENNSVNKRFIRILRDDFCVNLFDLATRDVLFDNDNTITYVSICNLGDTSKTKTHYCLVQYENGKQRIFSFDNMEFIGKAISHNYELSYPLNQLGKWKYYRDDLAIVTKDGNDIKYDDRGMAYTPSSSGILSLENGKMLTKLYPSRWTESFMYVPNRESNSKHVVQLDLLTFGKKRKDYSSAVVIMYDGLVYPFNDFATQADQIFDGFFSKTK